MTLGEKAKKVAAAMAAPVVSRVGVSLGAVGLEMVAEKAGEAPWGWLLWTVARQREANMISTIV